MKQNGHKPKRRQRNYSDAEKAAALVVLDFCKGNEAEAARRLGVPRQTLQEWSAGRVPDGVPETRHEKKQNLGDALEDLAFNLVEKLSASKDVNSVDLGIVVDKMLLLRGEPNAISKDVTHAAPEARRGRILELVQKAKVA